MLLLVTGASGFLGSQVVRLAFERGHEVRSMVRRIPNPEAMESLPSRVCIGDLTDPASLATAASGVDGIIHCAATTSEGVPDLDLSRRTNIEGTASLILAARQGCPPANPRWIQISSMSAHPASTSVYGMTKFEADQTVRSSPLPWTILKPSIIYGPGGKGLVSKTLSIMRKLPIVPVVGSGRELLRPVHVADVARAALDCLERPITTGKSYMIGGADEISFNDFLRRLAHAASISRPLVHIPIPIALAMARALGLVSRNPPITVDNVLGIKQAQRVDIAEAVGDFGFSPMTFEEGLAKTF